MAQPDALETQAGAPAVHAYVPVIHSDALATQPKAPAINPHSAAIQPEMTVYKVAHLPEGLAG